MQERQNGVIEAGDDTIFDFWPGETRSGKLKLDNKDFHL